MEFFLMSYKTCTIWQSRVLGKPIRCLNIFFMQYRCKTRGYLSPLHFALFINDFSKYIEGKYTGLSINNCYPTLLDDDIAMLTMFVLYADTIVLAGNACELQKALDAVHDYCGMYKLTVNIKKTRIIVFSRGNVKRFPMFKYGKKIQLRLSVIIFILALS